MKRTIAVLLAVSVFFPGFRVRAAEAGGGDAAERKRVEALIVQLRSERFEEREAAMAELRKAGPEARVVVKRLLGESDPELAWRVKEILQGDVQPAAGDPISVEDLIAQFGRENGETRLVLMRQIVEQDSTRGRPWLLSLLTSENDAPLLTQALAQLSYLGGGDAESKAVQAFYNQCGEELKGQALWTLSGLDPEAARPLVREALKAENADLKTWAVRSAGRIQDRVSAPFMRDLARGGDNVPVEQQNAALGVLVGFKDEALKEILPPLLRNADEELFAVALRGVGVLKMPEMVPVLLELYGDPKRVNSRSDVLAAMGALGDPRFVPVLSEALVQDRRNRHAAIQALMAMRATEAAPRIVGCLADPSNYVRVLACTALGQLGYREGIPQLKKALSDRDEDVALAAAAALLNLGDPAGEEKILSMAQQEAAQHIQGRGALQMLSTYRIEKGIPLLKQLVAEGREEAIWSLMDLCQDRETYRFALRQLLASRNDGSGRFLDLQVALFYSQSHLYGRAAGILEEMSKRQSAYGFAYSRLANVYHESGRYAEAEAAFGQWGKLEPDDGTYLNNRAWFYCTAHTKEYLRPAQAIALAQRALAQRPDEHFIVDTYGWALYAAGQYEDALRELNRSLSMIEPADKKSQSSERARIARALDKLGRKDEALQQMSRALVDSPKDGELWFAAAGFYAATGHRDQAVDALHRAVDLGYRNVTDFKLDTDFDGLREDTGFQYALRRAEEENRELERVADEVEKEVRVLPPSTSRVPGFGNNGRVVRTIDGQMIVIE